MYEDTVVQLCSDYAGVAHIGQFRKDKITPYITHPARVAGMVESMPFHRNYVAVAAAWLHDVMEDCLRHCPSCTSVPDYQFIIKNHNFGNGYKDIRKFLLNNPNIDAVDGKEILELVVLLTMSQDKNIPKKVRKKTYLGKIRRGHSAGALLKYCDRIDNLTTVHHFSKDGFAWYIEDTEMVIEQLSTNVAGVSPMLKLRLDRKLEEVRETYTKMYG
jgi:(p)ppGpp synthase/HD superfamily hydrolase